MKKTLKTASRDRLLHYLFCQKKQLFRFGLLKALCNENPGCCVRTRLASAFREHIFKATAFKAY